MVDSFPLHVNFRQWIKSVHRDGINGRLEVKKYVPAKLLMKYWTEESVRQIIGAITPGFPVQFERIAGRYLKVFSTLVFIDQPEHIPLFLKAGIGDNKLPLDSLPDTWNGVVDKFLVEQWQFCPWDFSIQESHMRDLYTQQILPVRYIKPPMTEQDDPTEVFVVKLDSEYCKFPPEVVFKTYKGSDRINLYDREADVYTRLMRLKPTGIAKCYGSLAYTDTNIRIIILEYASKGSLVEFFELPPPIATHDYRQLWERLLDLFEGLYVLHNIDENDSKSLTGIHQDIQPANILVFPGETESPYDVFFKLADFGLTELVRVTGEGEGETFPVNNEGNKMYSAPEAFSNERIQSELRPRINSLADLWSLGAVLSEFMVWSIGGKDLREIYRTSRKDAVARLSHLKDYGFQAYFHDGVDVLPEVVNFHKDILRNNKKDEDVLSSDMSQFILAYMLVSSGKRLQAKGAKTYVANIINCAQSSHKPSRPRTPETTYRPMSYNPSPHNRSARTSTQVTVGPKVTVQEIYKVIKDRIMLERLLPRSTSDAGMSFPGMQNARNKVNAREGRDQIFVIDDCDSLRQHRYSIAITARVISYTVKITDKNGMDLYFASDSVNPQSCRNSSAIERKINKKQPVYGSCDMAKCLDDVLKDVCRNGMQPTSVYIFTDGICSLTGIGDRVKEVIFDAITSMVKTERKPRDLMFQFVQFGRDPEAYELLKSFDDNCKRVENGVEFDIVDRKNWDSHVPKIIVGSLDCNNDNDDN